jgi:hypothetical protein
MFFDLTIFFFWESNLCFEYSVFWDTFLCNLFIFFLKKMFVVVDNDSQGQLCKRTRVEIAAAKERTTKRKIVIEWAILIPNVMVAAFAFINQIFEENGWLSMFNTNKVFPRLVREFYMNMEIVQTVKHCPVLEIKVHGTEIMIDPTLISLVTNIPLSPNLRIPFQDFVDPPSWEDLRMYFDPQGAQVWH